MKQQQLQKTLSNLVTHFGYDNVHKALGKLCASDSVSPKSVANISQVGVANSRSGKAKKSYKPNAIKFVQSLKVVDVEKRKILSTLARKYDDKEFMPHVSHVRDFLFDGERDVACIKSRQQVTNTVFKRLSNMETSQLNEMLERGLYGPPKRLESYARAIEGFQRSARSV